MSRAIPVAVGAGVDPARGARLAAELGVLGTLEDVFAWARAQRPEARLADVVVQDELTHDVVLDLGDAFAILDAT